MGPPMFVAKIKLALFFSTKNPFLLVKTDNNNNTTKTNNYNKKVYNDCYASCLFKVFYKCYRSQIFNTA